MIEKIVVESVEGDRLFKLVRGQVFVRGVAARFEGVIYQSVGGPNVRAMIDSGDAEKLRQHGLGAEDVEKLELILQEKILNGEVEVGETG
ncbi:MAG: hypothetical protein QXN23_06345 [Candidatus Caldarchaeum sp.]|uniref:Uncharacterized protein n=1 Tax=Caldiarchaeum subterraneum TaxID=311458 RepID=A0A7C4E1E1_CALS0|nr:hypothetical protein [Candidatus Caldarchaeales archaeon]